MGKKPIFLLFWRGMLLLLCSCILCGTLLCGCATEKDGWDGEKALSYEGTTFSLYAQGTFGQTSVAFRLFHEADGGIKIVYSEPQTCQNLSYTVTGTEGERKLICAYDGMEVPIPLKTAPGAVLAMVQCFSLQGASMTECKLVPGAVEGEQDTFLSFLCETGTVEVRLEPNHGLPRSMQGELYGTSFSLTFSEWMREGTGQP